jgi:hypothetical protein
MSAHLLFHLLLVMYYFPPHPQILTNLDGSICSEIDIHMPPFHCLQLLQPHFTRLHGHASLKCHILLDWYINFIVHFHKILVSTPFGMFCMKLHCFFALMRCLFQFRNLIWMDQFVVRLISTCHLFIVYNFSSLISPDYTVMLH